jgi:hypothetical protein
MLIARWLGYQSGGIIGEHIKKIYQTQHFAWFGWSINCDAIENYN